VFINKRIVDNWILIDFVEEEEEEIGPNF